MNAQRPDYKNLYETLVDFMVDFASENYLKKQAIENALEKKALEVKRKKLITFRENLSLYEKKIIKERDDENASLNARFARLKELDREQNEIFKKKEMQLQNQEMQSWNKGYEAGFRKAIEVYVVKQSL